ncbi:MAG: VOC family protein [Dorea sp.]|nr:VOC family protein [Dorea sp.]
MIENYIVKGLSHIGIRTHQLQESVDYYVNNFGFEMFYKKRINGLDCWFIEKHGLILEFVDSGAEVPKTEGVIYHISFEVVGIEALVAELKEKGVIPAELEISVAEDFFPAGMKNIFFYGINGEKIELFEMTSK